MSFAAPSSQAAGERPIAFLLDDRTGAGAFVEPVTLSIRPEGLTRTDPSRIAVQQTLGGAWADSFGAGLATITISGHTGWRRDVGLSQQTNGQDGEARFLRLRDTVFAQWHLRREAAVKSGRDPNLVQLIFSDALNSFTATVLPQSFVLQRSKSRPLLMQYQIAMLELSAGVRPAALLPGLPSIVGGDVLRTLGLTSLADSIDKIESFAKDITSFIDGSIGAPVKQFMATTAAIYRRVDSAVRSVDGITSSLVSVAQSASQAGMNIFRSIGAVLSLPQRAMARLTEVAAAYTNIFCLLKNAIKRLPQYDDYSSLYGASNCSSTAGGRPLSAFSGLNTFAGIQPPAETFGVKISGSAQASLQGLARADVVLAPPSPASLLSSLTQINLGLEVA